MKIYCLYDRKSSTYGTVFTSENNQTAQRYFQFLCFMPANEMVRDDVELHCVGQFDNKTGHIINTSKEFVSNFVYEETFTELIRRSACEDLLKNLAKKEVKDNE